MGELTLKDLDGDALEIAPVPAFGDMRLSIFCREESGDECGVALKLADVVRLRDYLNEFIATYQREAS